MRCDDCGRDIPQGQEVEMTGIELVGLLLTSAWMTGTVVKVCRRCAGRRHFRELKRHFVVVLLSLGVFAALMLIKEIAHLTP